MSKRLKGVTIFILSIPCQLLSPHDFILRKNRPSSPYMQREKLWPTGLDVSSVWYSLLNLEYSSQRNEPTWKERRGAKGVLFYGERRLGNWSISVPVCPPGPPEPVNRITWPVNQIGHNLEVQEERPLTAYFTILEASQVVEQRKKYSPDDFKALKLWNARSGW